MRLRIANCGLRIWVSAVVAALTLLIAVQPVRAYVTARFFSNIGDVIQQRWAADAFPIPWTVNPSTGANVTGSESQTGVFSASFASWEAVSPTTISFVQGEPADSSLKPGYDQINLITTNLSAEEYESSALGFTIVWAFDQAGVDAFDREVSFAGQILEADILFNPGAPFSTAAVTPAGQFDLQSVATHEIGHLLGLDHSTLLSAVMLPHVTDGTSFARTLSADDAAGVSSIYPSAEFTSKGTLTGTVRTTSNAVVYGAIVTAVNANGQPVASSITDTAGRYTIAGLDSGAYTIYAEPLDLPVTASEFTTLGVIHPGIPVFTNFTTRFR